MSIVSGSPPAAPASMGGLSSAVEDLSVLPELNSLRFDGSSYLSKIYSTSLSNNLISLSFWVKRSEISTYQELFGRVIDNGGNWYTKFRFSNDTIDYRSWDQGRLTNAVSNNLFRDSNSWYHILLTVRMETGVDQVKIYVNSVEISYNQQTSNGQTNDQITIFNNNTYNLGNVATQIGNGFKGYLANIHFIDGQALDADSFGEWISDIWRPRPYTGDYGVNGFHLDFAGENMLYDSNGKLTQVLDASSNDNHWQAH